MILFGLARRLPVMLAGVACQTCSVDDRRNRLARARLYLVCDLRSDQFLEAALRGGVDIVQLRVKRGSDEAILRGAERYAAVCAQSGALLIVNDRPDLATRAGADGVHIGQEDMSLGQARAIVGEGLLVGLSTHSRSQVDRSEGADYIGVGPVYETPTKPGRPAAGLGLVQYAAANARVPFFAIGGINASNVDHVVSAGAERIAVVRALSESEDPEGTARALRLALPASEVPVGPA
jgi:thiamine-phosphate pyrophosphorylase